MHKIIFVETPSTNRDHGRVASLEAEDGSRFIGVLETTNRGSDPFHSVVSVEVVSTKECFVTETTSLATASSNVCPKIVKLMSVDKMVRSSKTICSNQSLCDLMKLPLLLSTKVVDLVGEERGVIDKAFIIADRTQAKKSLCKDTVSLWSTKHITF